MTGRRACLLALLLACPAAAHDSGFSPAQNAWLNRQIALDRMKCCDEHDVHVGVDVVWRVTDAGGYEVLIEGAWQPVPPGRLMRDNPGDPSPWGHRALLFRTGADIWCFRPGEPLT